MQSSFVTWLVSSTLVIFTGFVLVSCASKGRVPTGDAGDASVDGAPRPDADTGPSSCVPGTGACDGNVYWECADDGVSRSLETSCDDACDPRLRCVVCRPGTRRCAGTVSEVCTANGAAYVPGRDCADWGSTCGGDGFCADVCADAERSNSNVGCEYWPVPLANTAELNPAVFDYRVVVANPNETPAMVRVRRGATEVFSGTIAAGELSEISLPWIDGQSFNIPRDSWGSFVTADGAYRLTSDVPVIASQFNPFEYSVGGTFSYTNDATLLYPAHVLTGDYVGASYFPLSRRTGDEGGFGGGESTVRYPGYIAVVGVTAGMTRVEVTARGNVAADAGGRWPATPVGGSFVFELAQGEVAHIVAAVPPECMPGRPGFVEERDCETVPIFGEMCDIFQTCAEIEYDLTGTRIIANQPVATFGGHTCAYIPTTAQACDHLEVQMPPIQSWGREYVSAPMADGSMNGTNVVRVLPAFESTTVTISPPQGGTSGGTLSPGQFLEFDATTPFTVSGSGAVLVTQYLRGQYATMPESARGDPAMTVLVPSEQFRSDYTFILPSSYNASTNGQNHIMVIRPPGSAITLDGAPLGGTFAPIGASEVGVVVLDGGTHAISSTVPFGLIAYGMGSFTSYATPAGLNFEQITILF
jgi:hypothetical protein